MEERRNSNNYSQRNRRKDNYNSKRGDSSNYRRNDRRINERSNYRRSENQVDYSQDNRNFQTTIIKEKEVISNENIDLVSNTNSLTNQNIKRDLVIGTCETLEKSYYRLTRVSKISIKRRTFFLFWLLLKI